MSFALSVYDLFAYAIPGSLYLAILGYVTERLNWIDISRIGEQNAAVLIVAGAISAYAIGQMTEGTGRLLSKLVKAGKKSHSDARMAFLRNVPQANERPYVRADLSTLRAGIEVTFPEASSEVTRFQAVGLMLRNCSAAFFFATIVATMELFASSNRIFASPVS